MHKNKRPVSWRGGLSRNFIVGIFFAFVLVGLISATLSDIYASPKNKNRSSQSNESANDNIGTEKLTVWQIVEMNDWLLWPFILLTGGGIMLISYRALYEYREKNRGRSVLQRPLQMSDLRTLGQLSRTKVDSRVGRLIQQMFATFRKTRQAGPIGNDISQFLSEERQLFETFQRVMGYMSDSAGALGLLGTVWGIFVTFHSGQLDGPAILRGMSVALITTLTGLIISLILNLGVTGVFSIFNNQLNLLATRAEELRQLFLAIETQKPAGEPPVERPVSSRIIQEPEYKAPYPEPGLKPERNRPPMRKTQPEPVMNTADFTF